MTQNKTDSTVHESSLHYHLLGIGGIGMSAFARLLKARGHRVSGCDQSVTELTKQLSAEGIEVAHGHHESHIKHKPYGKIDVLVASEAVPKSHPEILAAKEAGILTLPRMSLLGELLSAGPSIGVIGTHGKTTTTSMLAVAMTGAGLDPSAFIGGKVKEFGNSNARVGGGPFVAEVDESDRKFADLHCETAVFTNAEGDHVGGNLAVYWETLEEQNAGFSKFLSQASRVLYCLDWGKDNLSDSTKKPLIDLCGGAKQLLSYGLSGGADYRATNLKPDESGTSFTVEYQGGVLGDARVEMPGLHNVQNALAALSVVHMYGGSFTGGAKALANFRGPGRRWQILGTALNVPNGALVIDDYAHNATKVASAVQAAIQTGRRVRVVFQPHRYLRTKESWPLLADALMKAEDVMLLDIAAASETPIEGIHTSLILGRMQQNGHQSASYWPDRAELLEHLRKSASPGEIIVAMGAGDVWEIAHELVKA